MAVGHEWGWKQFKNDDLNGTGVWTISNRYFPGVPNTQISPTAISTARKVLGYNGTDDEFDFGKVYGDTRASPTRQVSSSYAKAARQSAQVLAHIARCCRFLWQIRSSTLLRDFAADHKLTKRDLMLTLSDHSYGIDPHEPYQRMPHWDGTEIDEHTIDGGISASSMVSDFTLDGSRKIAWHTGPNPCMTVYCECANMIPSFCLVASIRKPARAGLTRQVHTLSLDPVIFHHEGHISPMPDWLVSNHPWWGFRYVIYDLAGERAMKRYCCRLSSSI